MPTAGNILTKWGTFIISFLGALFITYQNFISYEWELYFFSEKYQQPYIIFFVLRYIYFFAFIWVTVGLQTNRIKTPLIWKRFLISFLISSIAYGVYVSLSFMSGYQFDFYIKTLLYQFLVICIFSAISGHVFHLTNEKKWRELEIERLKTESIQSRYVALTNQINPHFFFNSLNGLSSLIRKGNETDAIEYVNKLSDVFRYVLQSEKKSLVTVNEELQYLRDLTYMMEVRFASKLVFRIHVPDEFMQHTLPVLSLLPLIDNIVIHNIIDSEHRMEVKIWVHDGRELCVSNPLFPKPTSPYTNGTGLLNLTFRFSLLTRKDIRISNDGKVFTVFLPLIRSRNEDTDS